MAQHQFFYNYLNKYNTLLTTELQNLANKLEAHNRLQEGKLLQIAISLHLKVSTFNQQAIETIEQHIKDSLCSD
ncbi:hypothetical protein [Mastigocladopsis repens]|uniref:hypothetical protein n=1 Tax=Mastigocladopsis repens TaxID=221287 RepID=UPI000374D75D|nr:hypothetical protein [Mastigocladopsis repens]